MPYIPKKDRKRFDKSIKKVLDEFAKQDVTVGEVNYVISRIIWELFDDNYSYTNGNNLMGVLECVKQELYRRKLANLEDKKILENGDLEIYDYNGD